ncbi:MAG TPA: hypothetical protein VNT30_05680 [Stellaceae bacterium]|nr:hypothetical protein [Stellaceae bacterium]
MSMVWIESSQEHGFKEVKGGFVYYPFGHLFHGFKVTQAQHDEIKRLQGRYLEHFGIAAVFFLILWPFLRRLFVPFPIPYNILSGPLGLLTVMLVLLIWQQIMIRQILRNCPVSDVQMTLADRRRSVAAVTSDGRLWITMIGSGVMTAACLVLAIGSAVIGDSFLSIGGTAATALFGWSLAESIEVFHLKLK